MVFDDGAIAKDGNFSPETQVAFGNNGDFDRSKPFSISVWTQPSNVNAVKILLKHDGGEHWQGWELADDKPVSAGYSQRVAHFVVRLANHWPDDAIEVQTKERVPVSKLSSVPVTGLHQLSVEYDGSGKASGIKFYVSGKQVETEILKDHLRGSFRTTALLEVGDKSLGTPFEGAMDDLRIYDRDVDRQRSGRPGGSPARARPAACRSTGGPTTRLPPSSPIRKRRMSRSARKPQPKPRKR